MTSWAEWQPQIYLGRYEEKFRRYLLDQAGFPVDAVLCVLVSNSDEPSRALLCPRIFRFGSHEACQLAVPGMRFMVVPGSDISKDLRALCTVRSPQNLVYLTSEVENLARGEVKWLINERRCAAQAFED